MPPKYVVDVINSDMAAFVLSEWILASVPPRDSQSAR
jgi:hypothetical protein